MYRSRNGIPEGNLLVGGPGVVGKNVSKAYGVVICVGCVNRNNDREQLELIRNGNAILFPSKSPNS